MCYDSVRMYTAKQSHQNQKGKHMYIITQNHDFISLDPTQNFRLSCRKISPYDTSDFDDPFNPSDVYTAIVKTDMKDDDGEILKKGTFLTTTCPVQEVYTIWLELGNSQHAWKLASWNHPAPDRKKLYHVWAATTSKQDAILSKNNISFRPSDIDTESVCQTVYLAVENAIESGKESIDMISIEKSFRSKLDAEWRKEYKEKKD